MSMAFLVLLVWTHLRIIILKERTLVVIKPNSLQVPKYDWYGYYGHQRSVSKYEQIMREDYAKWSYAPYISDAIRNEVKECRENVALFDLSSFGKVGTIQMSKSIYIFSYTSMYQQRETVAVIRTEHQSSNFIKVKSSLFRI